MKNKYMVGEVSKFLNISKDTLRYYDQIGIVTPKKSGKNGYRYYTMDNIVLLTYVLVLKDLDVPLNEIKNILSNNSLESMIKLIGNQKRVVEKKIKELQGIKSTINSLEKAFIQAYNYNNKFEVIESPKFIYKEIGEEIDSTMSTVMDEFRNINGLSEIVYTVIIKNICDIKKIVDNNVFYTVSARIEKFENEFYIGKTNIFEKSKCIHTVIRSSDDIKEIDLMELKKYLKENRFTINGDIIARAIAFEHIDEKPIDYYEVWVPIKEC
ncbi:MerR family transcriptional regulator [Clostridium septicum]|uniref:MerR family transcriptional regulator n=1 Tax=Clostridium septicum TaxID=1504 RepID=UPI00272EE72E|nr:MerR family transcriptional regulator [Clostridium septicum]WLF70170.1 MerR family transcriptional regulator [Clostridium septicum]